MQSLRSQLISFAVCVRQSCSEAPTYCLKTAKLRKTHLLSDCLGLLQHMHKEGLTSILGLTVNLPLLLHELEPKDRTGFALTGSNVLRSEPQKHQARRQSRKASVPPEQSDHAVPGTVRLTRENKLAELCLGTAWHGPSQSPTRLLKRSTSRVPDCRRAQETATEASHMLA